MREQVLVKAKKLYEHEREPILQRFDYIRKCDRGRLDRAQARRDLARRADARPSGSSPSSTPSETKRLARARRLRRLHPQGQRADRARPRAASSGSRRSRSIATSIRAASRGRSSRRRRWTRSSCRAARSPRRSGSRSRATSCTPTTSSRTSRGAGGSATSRRSPARTTRSSTAPATRAGSRARRSRIESRMMTIADIFDALTASDRPYKKAVPRRQGARHPRVRGQGRQVRRGAVSHLRRGQSLAACPPGLS